MNLEAIQNIVFRDEHPEKTKAILTAWVDRRKTPEQLQWAANTAAALAGYLQEDFGRWRTQIRRTFQFRIADISAAGGVLSFPGATLTYLYEANNRDRGAIKRVLAADAGWFTDNPRLAALLALLGFKPQAFELELNLELDPLTKVAALEAAGWTIDRESDAEVVALKEHLRMTVRTNSIQFAGLDILAVLRADGGQFSAALAAV